MLDVSLGIDPGANLGLAFCRRREHHETATAGYVVLHHATLKTPTEHTVAERLSEYRTRLGQALSIFPCHAAYVEVPWRYGKKGLSIYTRGGGNVGSIGLLIAITGCVLTVCHELAIPVYEVPAPTGFQAKGWEAQRELIAKQLTGLELKKHEAVACCLAVKGL